MLGGLLAEATGGRDIARADTNGGLSGVTVGGDKRLTASMGSGGGAGFGGGDGGLSGIDDTVGDALALSFAALVAGMQTEQREVRLESVGSGGFKELESRYLNKPK